MRRFFNIPFGVAGRLVLCTLLAAVLTHGDCLARAPLRIGYSDTLVHRMVRDRMKLVYERVGIPVEFVLMPHRRSVQDADMGLLDGELGRIKSLETKCRNLRRVKEPIARCHGVAYARAEGPAQYSEDLLDRLRVGCVLGVRWSQNLMARHASIPATAKHYWELFGMLEQDRVDLALANALSARAMLQEDEFRDSGIRELKPAVTTYALYHYLHKHNAELIPRLERAIRELRKELRWDEEPAP